MKVDRSTFSIVFNLLLAACLTLSLAAPSNRPVRAQAPGASKPRHEGKASLQHLLSAIAASASSATLNNDAALNKLDSHLQDLLADHFSGANIAQAARSNDIEVTNQREVLLDVYADGALAATKAQLEAVGMRVIATNSAFGGMIEGYLPLDSVLSAAQLTSTKALIPVMGSVVNTGSVTSQGDVAHNGPAARALGTTGTGVKVGIISDSMNMVGTGVTGSQGSGDLPASVTVLSDFAGGDDEGRAMAEIVYDTAPGITQMYFGTGMTGAVSRANSIYAFASNGVRVVADDMTSLTEPFFQDGVVAQAVDAVYNAGVAYFVSAGNFARQSYEANFVDDGTQWHDHDFNPGTGTWLQQITTVANGDCFRLELQWDDPWGAATHDFDVYLYDYSNPTGPSLASSTDYNLTSGLPSEFLYWCNSTGSPVSVGLEISRFAGSTTAYLKYLALKSGTFSVAQFDTASDAIGPDAASAAGAMTVGAVRYNDIGLNDAEPYSSRGPYITRLFNTSGVRLGSPIYRAKPNIAGADCVATSNNYGGGAFGGGVFCGTSAAAPVVAGIAALALSANPALTSGSVYALMSNPADTIDCTAAGNPDDACGYGFSLADHVVKDAFWLNWYGSVSITSTRNVVAVGRPHVGAEVMTYDSFASGSLTSYVPMLFKNAFGGSYDSAFYIQNVDTSNAAHVTVKYYDNTGGLTCTKLVDTIPALASHGIWVPGESCLPVGWVGAAVVTSSDFPIVTVARPHVGAQVMTYNGFASGSTTTYLPMLFKNAFGGTYDSAFYFQNVDSGNAAHVTVKYYDSTGTLTCTKLADTVPPLASHGIWVPSESCLPVGWVGGAVVTSSDYPIVAVARPHIGAQVTTYDGFAAGSLTSYVPMLFKNAFGGSYDSAFYMQNVDSSNPAHVTVKYYDSTGTLTCTKLADTIPPLSSHGIWVPSESCLPVGWVGAAVVTSSDYPIVAVGRPHVGAEVTAYNGFTSGTAGGSVPMLFKNMWGSYNSAFYIQNTDPGGSASVTVKFYDVNGFLRCQRSDTIPALASLGYWVPAVACAP